MILARNHFQREQSTTGRIQLFDLLKGSAMLLVLLHHSKFPYGKYILAFHMPLLFIISGYIRKKLSGGGYSNRNLCQYIEGRFIRLIIPYFLFEIINLSIFCFYCCIRGIALPNIYDAFYSIIVCINNDYVGLYGRLWFIPCAFVTELYSYTIIKYFERRNDLIVIAPVFFFILSFIITKLIQCRLPFTMDTAFMATAYYLLGYLSEKIIAWLLNIEKPVLKIVFLVLSVGYLYISVRYLNANTLMYANEYGNYITSITAAISGSVAFFIIIGFLGRFKKYSQIARIYVLWLGMNSLVIFPVHLFIKVLSLKTLGVYAFWYVLFIIMLIGTVPIVQIINRFFPILTGAVLKKKE